MSFVGKWIEEVDDNESRLLFYSIFAYACYIWMDLNEYEGVLYSILLIFSFGRDSIVIS